MVKVYLAGPFFDSEGVQVGRIERLEEALNLNTTVEDYFSPMRNQIEEFKFGTKEWREAVFKNDVIHIDEADVIVAIADYYGKGMDDGTAFELGYAYSKNKPIVVIHEGSDPLNLMVSDSLQYYTKNIEELKELDLENIPYKGYVGDVL